MIGITFALPSESSDLVRRLSDCERDGALLLGKIDNREVSIIHTGVGANKCSARLEALIHKTRPKLVISSGFAGAVNDQLQVGDLILAENFSDRELLGRAEQILRGANAHRVQLFTSTSIVDSIAERNEIARASGAAAVDMETGAIANICSAHGVPLLSLRAISDAPSEPFPAPPAVLFDVEKQRTNYRRLVSYLVQEPPSLLRLFRFARRIKRVRATLTEATVALVREL